MPVGGGGGERKGTKEDDLFINYNVVYKCSTNWIRGKLMDPIATWEEVRTSGHYSSCRT